jgi:hypothetical protein
MNEYFDEDQLPDELPADFADFDDEVPDELPAEFVDFEEDRSLGPSVLEVPSPSVPQSSAAPARGFGSFQALEPLLQEEHDPITAFAQALGATVTRLIPKGMPDPGLPRDAAHDWDTWRRRRDDCIFRRAREDRGHKSTYEQEQERDREIKDERQRQKAWLLRQRQIAHGWAKFVYWVERSPQEAQKYRHQHEDEVCEWLVKIAVGPRFRVRPKTIASIKPKSSKPRPTPRVRGMGSENHS